MTRVEAVDVVVRVTATDTDEQRSFVLRRVLLPILSADPDDWAAETCAALRLVHDDDVYGILAAYSDD